MAAPLRIADVTSGLIGGEDGRVYVYNGKHTIFGDMTGKCKSWMSPCPEEKVMFSAKLDLAVQGRPPMPLGHVHHRTHHFYRNPSPGSGHAPLAAICRPSRRVLAP